jgi:hypothetical protein
VPTWRNNGRLLSRQTFGTGGFRARAEAAIPESQGDLPAALGKLAEVEAALLTFPSSPQRENFLRLLNTWKAELGGSSVEPP